jgi:hypothetical protein
MRDIKSGGPIRKFVTRALATGALLGLYALGTITTTGVVMTAGVTDAHAQKGKRGGGGRGRGRGRGRGGNAGAAAAGAAIGIIGGIIATEAARANQRAIEECFRRFNGDYDPETRTGYRRGRAYQCP